MHTSHTLQLLNELIFPFDSPAHYTMLRTRSQHLHYIISTMTDRSIRQTLSKKTSTACPWLDHLPFKLPSSPGGVASQTNGSHDSFTSCSGLANAFPRNLWTLHILPWTGAPTRAFKASTSYC